MLYQKKQEIREREKGKRTGRGAVLGTGLLVLLLVWPQGTAFAQPTISSRTTRDGDIVTTVITKTEELGNSSEKVVSTYITDEATGRQTRQLDGTYINRQEAITVRTLTERETGGDRDQTSGSIRAVYDPTVYAASFGQNPEFSVKEESVRAAFTFLHAALLEIPDPREISTCFEVKAQLENRGNVAFRLPKTELAEAVRAIPSGVCIRTAVGSLELDDKALETVLKEPGGFDLVLSLEKKEAMEADLSSLQYPRELEGCAVYTPGILSGGEVVTEFGGGTLLFTVPLAQDWKELEFRVYQAGENGRMNAVDDFDVDRKEGLLSFSSESGAMFAVGIKEPQVVFFDVRTGDWFKEAVTWLAGKGLVRGTSDILFSPDAGITRAELLQILYNKNGVPEVSITDDFQDVDTEAWYAAAVSWATEQGIVSGTARADGVRLFHPEDPISRQDMAVILAGYLEKVEEKQLSTLEEPADFSDAVSIADYARQAVKTMQTAGIISGEQDAGGTVRFRPQEGATRAEAASMLAGLFRR